nr:unnamed protein product [Amyelois transitella]
MESKQNILLKSERQFYEGTIEVEKFTYIPPYNVKCEMNADISNVSTKTEQGDQGGCQQWQCGVVKAEFEAQSVDVKIEPLAENFQDDSQPVSSQAQKEPYQETSDPLTSFLLERQSKLLESTQAADQEGTRHARQSSNMSLDVNMLNTDLNTAEDVYKVTEVEKEWTDGEDAASQDWEAEKREPDEGNQNTKKQDSNYNPKSKDQGIVCCVCKKYITRSKNLKLHMRVHTGERPYECKMCGSRFSNSSMLQIHKRTHTGEKPYECDVCHNRFAVKSHLQRHSKTHTGEKPYECNVCRSRFTSNSNLQGHLKTHTGEKPFQCDVCQKSFARNSVLQRHIRTHTGEKPHECNLCEKSFADRNKLLVHLRTHTGERPYECSICPARFSDNGRLKIHIRTHTGEKPYECTFCQRPFADKSNLRSHMLKHNEGHSFLRATMRNS